MLSDSLTWLGVLAFALSIGVWFRWWARRVSDEDEPPMRLMWPLVITGAFVSSCWARWSRTSRPDDTRVCR